MLRYFKLSTETQDDFREHQPWISPYPVLQYPINRADDKEVFLLSQED